MKSEEKRLLSCFRALDEAGRDTLLAFAQFLAERRAPAGPLPAPNPAPRPPGETPMAALKRLKAGYPMLDSAALLNEASAIMTQHLLQGRPAAEAVDALEALFARHYRELVEERARD